MSDAPMPPKVSGPDAPPFAGISPDALVRRPKRRIPSQTIILFLVVGVSAVALWWMRREGLKTGVTVTTTTVDYKGEEDLEKAKTYDRIMADLARAQKPLDVALADFGKSPFMVPQAKPTIEQNGEPLLPMNADEQAAQAARERAAARKAELQMQLQGMTINGIMAGTNPLARIDGKMLRIGDTIGDFTVTGIEGMTVSLKADDDTYTLTLDPNQPSVPHRAPVKMIPKTGR
ncbi:MAG: hypothetical protein GC200_10375 [Tepidisphaera sp.]|nr:hypothetical protein [Tepidisphaera sp.]